MMKLQEDKLTPIIIDLSVKKSQINESFLRMFGASIELILKKMFGTTWTLKCAGTRVPLADSRIR